jgi:hypothetical protein
MKAAMVREFGKPFVNGRRAVSDRTAAASGLRCSGQLSARFPFVNASNGGSHAGYVKIPGVWNAGRKRWQLKVTNRP